MQFVVIARDYPDGLERRLAVRPQHLQLIDRLRAAGHCLYAARLVNSDGSGHSIGSMMVFDYPSREELDTMLATEPYSVHRVWETVDVLHCDVAPAFLRGRPDA